MALGLFMFTWSSGGGNRASGRRRGSGRLGPGLRSAFSWLVFRPLVFFACSFLGLLTVGIRTEAQVGLQLVRSCGFPGALGDSPSGGLIEGNDHALYGTTVEGGANGSYGVIYRVGRDGTGYAALHHFAGAPSDGSKPVATLAEG